MSRKITFKILSLRHQKVIGIVVDCVRVGFVPITKLGENVLLANELVRGYNEKFMD